MKPSLVAIPFSEHVSFSYEGPLLETLEFFEISHGSCQPLNFLPYLTLSTQYSISIFISLIVTDIVVFNATYRVTNKPQKVSSKSYRISFHLPFTLGFVSNSYLITVEVPRFTIGFTSIRIRRQNG